MNTTMYISLSIYIYIYIYMHTNTYIYIYIIIRIWCSWRSGIHKTTMDQKETLALEDLGGVSWEDRFYTPPPPGGNFWDCDCARIETTASIHQPPPLGGGGVWNRSSDKAQRDLGGTTCLTLLVEYGLIWSALFIVSRITTTFQSMRHCRRTPALHKQC